MAACWSVSPMQTHHGVISGDCCTSEVIGGHRAHELNSAPERPEEVRVTACASAPRRKEHLGSSLMLESAAVGLDDRSTGIVDTARR